MKKILFCFFTFCLFFCVSANAEESQPSETIVETTTPTTTPSEEEVVETTPLETTPIETTPLETIPSEEVEEEVSLLDKGQDFIDKWLPIVTSSIMSAISAATVIITALGIILKLKRAISGCTDENAKLFREGQANLNQAISTYEEQKATNDVVLANTIEVLKSNYSLTSEDLQLRLNECFSILNQSKNDFQTQMYEVKNLIPQLISDFETLRNDLVKENATLKDIITSNTAQFEQMKKLICILMTTTPELCANGKTTEVLNVLNSKAYQDVKNDVTKVVEHKGV